MNEQAIVSKMHEYLRAATKELYAWLGKMLPRVGEDWWQVCVIDNLSYAQKQYAAENGYAKLEDLDLAALLRVADKSWYDMRSFAYLPTSNRQCVRQMVKVRNNWAHLAVATADKDVVLQDLDVILSFFENVIVTNKYTKCIEEFRHEIENADFSAVFDDEPIKASTVEEVPKNTGEIQEKDRVFLTGSPDVKGMVFSITDVGGTKKYEVFVDGEIKTFYEGQIQKINPTPAYSWVDLSTLQSNLTAYEINNPSAGNLYSLNAARIDFVPYQFRPALKLIKSDEPKILIADSVGVGKTIEAGLIVKELEARNELENILIICPKPLVAERKWELEMKRFDEEFVPLDGGILRQAISDTHRDEEWPVRYNKAIIPYSILDSRVYEGEEHRRGRQYGLLDLDPAPHFDLVIIDEAHHIRNGSLDKDKAYAYKCVRYFCEHANAVVMLTATPLQTSDDDLFTLMNLLRPDVIMDKDVFRMMSRPNEYIYKCSHAIRGAADGWQEVAIQELQNIKLTQWGENVIAKNPLYADVLGRLAKPELSREERVKLLSDVESLHSFNTMLNRTRRRDIQDFCIRRSYTVETQFTPQQYTLHNELLRFEYEALSKLHNVHSIPFMMSTIRRQAASCIFGLAPHIRDLITRRFNQMVEDPDVDFDEYDLNEKATSVLTALARHVLELADLLPEDDPKFDSICTIIDEKQKQENNKIIGVFERSIGECEEVLGAIGAQIEQIAVNTSLTEEERRSKLEQMADNEIRRMQELSKLEDEERGLFGFDLSNYTAAKEIKDAESPWISPGNIQRLVERYLKDRLGEGQYILGTSDLKQLRLSREARLTLLEDFRRLSNVKSALKRRWENYLKGSEPIHRLTFMPETASKERRAFFITPMHPLVKQAAKHFATNHVSHIHLEYYSDEISEGTYPFSIYAWSYVGLNPMFRVVPVCENALLATEFTDILQDANTATNNITVDNGTWTALEGMHISQWKQEKETYLAGIQSAANYKLESISSNYRNRKRSLEQKIRDAFDEKIQRMFRSELNTATEKYQSKVDEINDRTSRADIHTSLIANGVIEIKRISS